MVNEAKVPRTLVLHDDTEIGVVLDALDLASKVLAAVGDVPAADVKANLAAVLLDRLRAQEA